MTSFDAACTALRRLEEYRVLITDMNLSGSDGSELARLYKTWHPEGRVIMVSGWPKSRDVIAHVDCYMQKPIDISKILDEVKATL